MSRTAAILSEISDRLEQRLLRGWNVPLLRLIGECYPRPGDGTEDTTATHDFKHAWPPLHQEACCVPSFFRALAASPRGRRLRETLGEYP
jgi:hypothetical protein